jgi:acetolactate synthase small subunit
MVKYDNNGYGIQEIVTRRIVMCKPSSREQKLQEIIRLLAQFPDEVRDHILDDLKRQAINNEFDSPDDTQSKRPDSS